MLGLGMGELIIILALVLLLFGGKRIPMLGKSLAEAMKNFKKGLNDDQNSDDKDE